MVDQEESLQHRVGELEERVEVLSRQVAQLSAHLGRGGTPAAPLTEAASPEEEDVSEELLGWIRRSSLLPRVAALCFLLVVALVLRTLTDNHILGTQSGSLLGMCYAALLILCGAYQYRRTHPLAPVFTGCGAWLMFSIVVETHRRFAALPSLGAYGLLIATGIGMALISFRFRRALPILLGTLGMCLAGVAVDYPNPPFLALASLLLVANVLGFLAVRLRRCSWLRWILLTVTILMLEAWGIRLGIDLAAHRAPATALAGAWFAPVIVGFALVFMVGALANLGRRWEERVPRFDLCLPTVNVLWSFLALRYQLSVQGNSLRALGALGIAVALIHLGLGAALRRLRPERVEAATAFLLAATVLLSLSLPAVLGGVAFSLPVLVLAGLGLLVLSARWRSGGLRVLSYLLQFAAVGTLAYLLALGGAAALSWPMAVIAALLGLGLLLHYLWCRRHPPQEGTSLARFDGEDLSAVLLLLTALVSGFLAVRILAYHLLRTLPGNFAHIFSCSQSIVINLTAAFLMLLALVRRNAELRNVGILVALAGAAKVFLYDLFGTSGLPQVLSVLIFGLLVLVVSLVLGRWPRGGVDGGGEAAEEAN